VRSTSRRYASTLYVARRSERWAHGLRIRVMRYQLTIDPGSDPGTGRRRQVRRRFGTEKEARDALSEVAQQAAADQFVARRSVTVEQMCADWLKSLHNARATTIAGYTFVLAPLREQHGDLAAQKLTRAQLDSPICGGRPPTPPGSNRSACTTPAILALRRCTCGAHRRRSSRSGSATRTRLSPRRFTTTPRTPRSPTPRGLCRQL
jgi:hypothetical protein